MPRARKWKQLKKKACHSAYSDVTLNDYANASAGVGTTLRIKKGDSKSLQRECSELQKERIELMKREQLMQKEREKEQKRLLSSDDKTKAEDLNWFEKDLEDFHLGSDDETEITDQCDYVDVPTTRRRRKTASQSEIESKGLDYPFDLWYHLSLFIHPSDVGRFAATCRSACAMVYTSNFWRNLYLRYYNKNIKLPLNLRRSSIERIRGLRAHVIRAMFHLHRPMADKMTPLVPFENEPHELRGQRCMLTWHQPVKNMWHFCFKFSPGPLPPRTVIACKLPNKDDMLPGYDDLFYNPEEGCRILQVTVQNFVQVPMVMSMVLSQVYLTISADIRHYRLRLLFNSNLQGGNANVAEMVVDLDPVVNIRVLPWWDPKYPFTF